jgi:hypothetical protein
MAVGVKDKPKQRVAIVDDNPNHRRMFGQQALLAGFLPVPLDQRYPDIAGLVASVKEADVYGVLCDHRLREGNYAGFDGAEAVAALYEVPKPAILITDYGSVDINGPIRLFRRRIPLLIATSDMRPDSIIMGLKNCEREVVFHDVPLARRPRRALVLVEEVVGDQVNVFIPQWNPNEVVSLPVAMVPEALRPHLQKGNFLVAWVNTDAEQVGDLFFDDFQLPPANGATR